MALYRAFVSPNRRTSDLQREGTRPASRQDCLYSLRNIRPLHTEATPYRGPDLHKGSFGARQQ